MSVTPREIVDFWSKVVGESRWYAVELALDDLIRQTYEKVWHEARAGVSSAWEDTAEGALALLIVLDQFPRNMFRNDPRAYSSDARACDVAGKAIDRGAAARIAPDLREFLYMPFMHSEQLADQLRCVGLFRETGNTENLEYAELHADIIRRFGRFPHRNRVLGRMTTSDEQAFLDGGGFSG